MSFGGRGRSRRVSLWRAVGFCVGRSHLVFALVCCVCCGVAVVVLPVVVWLLGEVFPELVDRILAYAANVFGFVAGRVDGEMVVGVGVGIFWVGVSVVRVGLVVMAWGVGS